MLVVGRRSRLLIMKSKNQLARLYWCSPLQGGNNAVSSKNIAAGRKEDWGNSLYSTASRFTTNDCSKILAIPKNENRWGVFVLSLSSSGYSKPSPHTSLWPPSIAAGCSNVCRFRPSANIMSSMIVWGLKDLKILSTAQRS